MDTLVEKIARTRRADSRDDANREAHAARMTTRQREQQRRERIHYYARLAASHMERARHYEGKIAELGERRA